MRRLLFVVLCLFVSAASAVKTDDLMAEAVLVDGGAMAVLQSYQGTCKAGQKRIILIMTDGAQFGAFVGCWRREGDVVISEFVDGDTYKIPVAAHQWIERPGRPKVSARPLM